MGGVYKRANDHHGIPNCQPTVQTETKTIIGSNFQYYFWLNVDLNSQLPSLRVNYNSLTYLFNQQTDLNKYLNKKPNCLTHCCRCDLTNELVFYHNLYNFNAKIGPPNGKYTIFAVPNKFRIQ